MKRKFATWLILGVMASAVRAESPAPLASWPRLTVAPIPAQVPDPEAFLQPQVPRRLANGMTGWVPEGNRVPPPMLESYLRAHCYDLQIEPVVAYAEARAPELLRPTIAQVKLYRAPIYARLALLDGHAEEALKILRAALPSESSSDNPFSARSQVRFDYVALLSMLRGKELDPRKELDAIGDQHLAPGELNRIAVLLYTQAGDYKQAAKYAAALPPKETTGMTADFVSMNLPVLMRDYPAREQMLAAWYQANQFPPHPNDLAHRAAPTQDLDPVTQLEIQKALDAPVQQPHFADETARELGRAGFKGQAAIYLRAHPIDPQSASQDTPIWLVHRSATWRLLDEPAEADKVEGQLWMRLGRQVADSIAEGPLSAESVRDRASRAVKYLSTYYVPELCADPQERVRFTIWYRWARDRGSPLQECVEWARGVLAHKNWPQFNDLVPTDRLLDLTDLGEPHLINEYSISIEELVDALHDDEMDKVIPQIVQAYCQQARDYSGYKALGEVELAGKHAQAAQEDFERAAQSNPISAELLYLASLNGDPARRQMARWMVLGDLSQAQKLVDQIRRHEGDAAADAYVAQIAPRFAFTQSSPFMAMTLARARDAAVARGDLAEALACQTQFLFSPMPGESSQVTAATYQRLRVLEALSRKDYATALDGLKVHLQLVAPDVDLWQKALPQFPPDHAAAAGKVLDAAIARLDKAANLADAKTPYAAQAKSLHALRDGAAPGP